MKSVDSSRSETAKRRRNPAEEEVDRWGSTHRTSNTEMISHTRTSDINENAPIEVPRKSYQVYDISSQTNSICSIQNNEGSILVAVYNNTNAGRPNSLPPNNSDEASAMGNAWTHPATNESFPSTSLLSHHSSILQSKYNVQQNQGLRKSSHNFKD